MKDYLENKSSFLYRLLFKFIVVVILPSFCTWWIYGMVLNYQYAKNNLLIQQANMENSLSFLDLSMQDIKSAISAMEGNPEIKYYMEYQPYKKEMLFGVYTRLKNFINNLEDMSSYITKIKVYCEGTLPIYAPPFIDIKEYPLGDDVLSELETAERGELVWRIVDTEGDEFPVLYVYKKVYSEDHFSNIGYFEIELSPLMFEDYFNMIGGLSDDSRAVLTLYHGKNPIYSTSTEGGEVLSDEKMESGCEIRLLKNQYRNYLEIQELDMSIVRAGQFSDFKILPSENITIIFYSVIYIILTVLFIVFLTDVVSISKRIIAFSSFISHSNPEKLLQYQSGGKVKDEIEGLIDKYNSLINQNNSLISQVQKMELLTRTARYQALRGQIHPHFVYGTLETIRMMAMQNDDKEVSDMIFSFSALFRYSMSYSNADTSLKAELEIAKHYLTIQKIRFDGRLEYVFQVDEKLLEMKMPSFILQPILENAILYGISQTLDQCLVTVDIHEENDRIVFCVSNNGLAITEQRLQEVNKLLSGEIALEAFKGKNNGIALDNIKKRLAIFFEGQVSVQLALQEQQTATVITIEKVEK